MVIELSNTLSKGLGHPDTICDALAEQLSIALCNFYQERFGLLLHHNVDKVLLWGGIARPAFGRGKILAPSEIFLAGRATQEFKGVQIYLSIFNRSSTIRRALFLACFLGEREFPHF